MMISRRVGLSAGLGAMAVAGFAVPQARAVTLAITQMPWRETDAARLGAEIRNALGARRDAPIVALVPPAYGPVDQRIPGEIARSLSIHLGGAMNGEGFLFSPDGHRLLRGDGIAITSFARLGVAHTRPIEGAELLLKPAFATRDEPYSGTSCIAATAPDALDLGEVAADLSSSARLIDWTGACVRAGGRTLVTTVDLGALRRGLRL
jgi:hypothetical protein